MHDVMPTFWSPDSYANMTQPASDTPTLQEALKQDRAQFEDCTPCRVVGMLVRSIICLPSADRMDRQRNIPRPRRLHLCIRPFPDPRQRSRDTCQQEHIRSAEQTHGYHRNKRRHGGIRRLPVVLVTVVTHSQTLLQHHKQAPEIP